MKFDRIKTITFLLTVSTAVSVMAAPVSVSARTGWKSKVSLPSAGISYALSAKKVSLKDVKAKVDSKSALRKAQDTAQAAAENAGAAVQEAAGQSQQAAEKTSILFGNRKLFAANMDVVSAEKEETEEIVEAEAAEEKAPEVKTIKERIPEDDPYAMKQEISADPEEEITEEAETEETEAAEETEETAQENESEEAPAQEKEILEAVLTPVQAKEQRAVQNILKDNPALDTVTESDAIAAATTFHLITDEEMLSDPAEEPAQEAAAEDDGSEDTSDEPLVVAQVNDFVNVRKEPSTDSEIIGKLYSNSVGHVLEEADEDGWILISSGKLTGYIKQDFVAEGTEAKKIATDLSKKQATVTTTTLRVRAAATTESDVISLIGQGQELNIIEEVDGWYKVNTPDGQGYISADFADEEVIFPEAVSIEEEKSKSQEELYADSQQRCADEARRAAEEAKRAAQEAMELAQELAEDGEDEEAAAEAMEEAEALQAAADEAVQAAQNAQQAADDAVKAAAQAKAKAKSSSSSSSSSSSGGSISKGQEVVNYAMQFLGNPYVWGGTSLTNGADCSGFTMSVYEHFGVSLPHYDASQRTCGTAVNSLAEAQPGDLICYYGHVGIYTGNGNIVHASCPAVGITTGKAAYRQIVAIRRIF